jgi:hypothetical protein
LWSMAKASATARLARSLPKTTGPAQQPSGNRATPLGGWRPSFLPGCTAWTRPLP